MTEAKRGSRLSLDYCGEWFHVDAGDRLTVGREGDLQVDDNPFLHRLLLAFEELDGLWWVTNTGSRLSATVCDASTGAQSWLPPGARLPLVFAVTTVVFTAGPTTYELLVHVDRPTYTEPQRDPVSGDTTIGTVQLTVSQRQLIVAGVDQHQQVPYARLEIVLVEVVGFFLEVEIIAVVGHGTVPGIDAGILRPRRSCRKRHGCGPALMAGILYR